MKQRQSIYRTSFLAFILAVTVSSLAAGSAWAEGDKCERHGMGMQGHGYMGSGHDRHGMRPHNAAAHFIQMADVLELKDDQVAKLVKMRDDYIAKNATTEEELKAAYSDLPRLLYADDIDMKAVDAQFSKIGKLEPQLWHAFAQQLHDIKAMLTPDQKAALSMLHQMGHQGMGGHGEMHEDMHEEMPRHGQM